MNKEVEKLVEQVDLAGAVLCYALVAYTNYQISEEVMDCYRDTFAKQILSENNLYLEIEEDTSYVDGAGFERKRTTKRLIPLAEELKK